MKSDRPRETVSDYPVKTRKPGLNQGTKARKLATIEALYQELGK